MLTCDEVHEVVSKFEERVRWYGENVQDEEQRSLLFGNEVGADHMLLVATTDMMIEQYMRVSADFVGVVTPRITAAVSGALLLGMMLGKKVAEVSSVSEKSP